MLQCTRLFNDTTALILGFADNLVKNSRQYILLLAICISGTPIMAATLPLWEAGIGIGFVNTGQYRGSNLRDNFLIPYPYFTYRGERLKVDEGGIRGLVRESERLKIDFSVAGNVPVSQNDDGPRAGMPSLDPIGEIGPTVDYLLWEQKDAQISFWLRMPFRYVFSVGDPIVKYQGWSFSPLVDLVKYLYYPSIDWKISLALGPIISNRRYHNYFYGVTEEHVTPDRMLYDSDTGYSGSRITLTITSNIGNYWFGGLIRYDNLSSATFEDSPLVKSKSYFVVGLTVVWKFYKSKTLINEKQWTNNIKKGNNP